MILTVTANAALDVTYRISQKLRPHATHRVNAVESRAGGKAINTAAVLHTLGENVIASGFVGGATGEEIIARLPVGLRHRFTTVAGESRRALVVADGIDATGLWEPGPEITPGEWRSFLDRYTGLLRLCRVAVLSGSLPRGLAVEAYAQLVKLARQANVPVIVDCEGESLLAAIAEGPDIVKPNSHELATAVAHADTSDIDGTLAAAQALREAGAGTVVASRGADGLVAATPRGSYVASPPAVAAATNPTGAGDACVAALARGYIHRGDWYATLTAAVALSAAAAAAPVAGSIDRGDYLKYRHHVSIKER